MKRILTLILVFGATILSLKGQELKYSDLSVQKRPKGKFESYVAKDGAVYKVGDKMKVGAPSSNKTFAFIQQGDGLLTPVIQAPVGISGDEIEIKSISVMGTRRSGFSAMFRCKGAVGLGDGLFVEIEDAIVNGEIKSFGMTSDEALTELKKAKDKLDLGLITEEEYEKTKAKLIKYIN